MQLWQLYGESYGSYNVHVLSHLTNFVKLLGPLDAWSAFPFETFLHKIKKTLRSPVNLMSQMANRQAEMQSASIDIQPRRVTVMSKCKNNCILSNVGIILVHSINTSENDEFYSGWKCYFQDNVYTEPYPSKIIGIGVYSKSDVWVSDVTLVMKCVAFDFSGKLCVFPFVNSFYLG